MLIIITKLLLVLTILDECSPDIKLEFPIKTFIWMLKTCTLAKNALKFIMRLKTHIIM